MSEWDYTNERVLFWMDLNGDFEWVCSTITSQNIYGRAPTIILLTMRPSRLFVKIRCHAVPSTRKRSARWLEVYANLQCPRTPKSISDNVPYRFVTRA
ncbi:core histone macro-H2A.1 [Trichonephila clavipes]|nr:core histone macro-H2A.1 [Trichonephila clavipes]